MKFGVRFLTYGRLEGGTGWDVFGEPLKLSAFQWMVIPAILSVFLGWKAAWLNFLFAVLTITILFYYKRRMGLYHRRYTWSHDRSH
jgi:adenosylcobinamide-GDP ribazoletransferase